MRRASLVGLAALVLALGAAAWWLVGERRATAPGIGDELLPGFTERIAALEGLEIRVAGDTPVVTLQRRDGAWEVAQRPGWPANEREISRALFRLAETRRVEPKTDQPSLYARLGVEDVSADEATGAELRFTGGGEPLRLLVGKDHPSLGGSYVRLAGDARSWLVDQDIAPARNPVAWLDRRLVDLPLARVGRVRVEPASGPKFSLRRGEDGFEVVGFRARSRLDESLAAAAFAEQLALDDLGPDTGRQAERRHVFETLDGRELVVESWAHEAGTWARLAMTLDEEKATAWLAGLPPPAEGDDAPAPTLEGLREQVAAAQARFEGRQFLLPPHKATHLLAGRDRFLDE